MSNLFFVEIEGVMAVIVSVYDNRFSRSDQCLFDIIQIPTFFLTFSLCVSDSLDNGEMVLDDIILVLDIIRPINSRISA